MVLFNQTVPVDFDHVSKIVNDNWNLILDKVIKASQNHTFLAHNNEDIQFVIRVTPDESNSRFQNFMDELFLIEYMSNAGLEVCSPIPYKNCTKENKYVLRNGNLTISAFNYAIGSPIIFTDFHWMTNEKIVKATGRWLGKFHSLSQKFGKEYPEIAKRYRYWNTLHDGVLKDYEIDEKFLKLEGNSDYWGILHGDLNPSNYFYCEESDCICVFDWDQCQQGWFSIDIAQCCHASSLLKEAGMPVSGTPVPQANPEKYLSWILNGYESEFGSPVDMDIYNCMAVSRRDFYKLFCIRAQNEFVPDDMKPFIDFIAKHFVNKNESSNE